MHPRQILVSIFFFNDTAPTEIYTLSLHDALPILAWGRTVENESFAPPRPTRSASTDRKSTRLNSSHVSTSYAVFCLKKKKIRCSLTGLNKKKENVKCEFKKLWQI